MKKKMVMRGYRREIVPGRRDDDETSVERRARLRGLLAVVSTISGTAGMDFVKRDSNAAISIRRYAVLKTRPEQLT
jgi:hypothetical protein